MLKDNSAIINPFTEFKKSLSVIQPICIEGTLFTPTEFLSDLIDVYENKFNELKEPKNEYILPTQQS